MSVNSLITNRDTSKIFLFNNKYVKRTFKNISGGALTLAGGEVIGAITSGGDAGNYYITAAASTDGSQVPFGINVNSTTELADDETVEILICVSGEVDSGKLTFGAATTLTTLINSSPGAGDNDETLSVQDRLEKGGIHLKTTTENTAYDNA